MRWRIDGCICKPGMALGVSHCGSDDSLLARRWPPIGLWGSITRSGMA
jgi:hypothetical protein